MIGLGSFFGEMKSGRRYLGEDFGSGAVCGCSDRYPVWMRLCQLIRRFFSVLSSVGGPFFFLCDVWCSRLKWSELTRVRSKVRNLGCVLGMQE